jgi:hypothetical protein
MKKHIILLLLIGFVSLVHEANSQKVKPTYNEILESTINQKEILKMIKVRANRDNESSNLLFDVLSHDVFPAWYETPWDFSGISNVPGEGKIACGYFVSTTLKHVGFNLNRYKTAQQAASVIIHEICGKEYSKKYNSERILVKELSAKPNGLYVVGLDYHVGFLVVENNQVYFVHSDFFNGKVVREKASTSTAFISSQNYVLGRITNNSPLLAKWLANTRIYG